MSQRVSQGCPIVLQANVVGRRLPILNIQHGTQPKDSIGMPVAAWILGECLLRWASVWKPTEVCTALGF